MPTHHLHRIIERRVNPERGYVYGFYIFCKYTVKSSVDMISR